MYLFGGIPGTDQSLRGSAFCSGVCGQPSKPVFKDPRPLYDKQFQNAALQKIQSYFQQVPNTEVKLCILEALSTRSLTLQLLVETVSHLLSHFFTNNVITITMQMKYPSWLRGSDILAASRSPS
jgi:SMC interacting uncharacterized protein involved in chromosome segregation